MKKKGGKDKNKEGRRRGGRGKKGGGEKKRRGMGREGKKRQRSPCYYPRYSFASLGRQEQEPVSHRNFLFHIISVQLYTAGDGLTQKLNAQTQGQFQNLRYWGCTSVSVCSACELPEARSPAMQDKKGRHERERDYRRNVSAPIARATNLQRHLSCLRKLSVMTAKTIKDNRETETSHASCLKIGFLGCLGFS